MFFWQYCLNVRKMQMFAGKNLLKKAKPILYNEYIYS